MKAKPSTIAAFMASLIGAAATGSVVAGVVPSEFVQYAYFGGIALCVIGVLGSAFCLVRNVRESRANAAAAATADAVAKLDKPARQSRMGFVPPLGPKGSGPMDPEQFDRLRVAMDKAPPAPGGKRFTVSFGKQDQGAKSSVGAVLPPVAAEPVKAKPVVDPNKQVVYETVEKDDGNVTVIVEAGPKVKGNSAKWHDLIWQPKLKPIKNIAWQEKQKGDGKFKVRGIVSKENLAGVLEAIEKIG